MIYHLLWPRSVSLPCQAAEPIAVGTPRTLHEVAATLPPSMPDGVLKDRECMWAT